MADTVLMGFSSYKDASFELIVKDKASGEETTLCGTLKPGQLGVADRILPTCVFVEVEGPMLQEAGAAIQLADKHLAGKSIERRKALALDIQQAIIRHAGQIAAEAIEAGSRAVRGHG